MQFSEGRWRADRQSIIFSPPHRESITLFREYFSGFFALDTPDTQASHTPGQAGSVKLRANLILVRAVHEYRPAIDPFGRHQRA